MTKSEFIRKRCEPLFKLVENAVDIEQKPIVRNKIEIFVLRLIADVENLTADTADVDPYKILGEDILE